MAPERVPLLAGKLGHDERGRRHGGGLGGAVPGEHLHQPVHHRRRRADPPERGLAEPRFAATLTRIPTRPRPPVTPSSSPAAAHCREVRSERETRKGEKRGKGERRLTCTPDMWAHVGITLTQLPRRLKLG
uniref:Uncharacterized protein n=1 Tax=Oryza glumipatula TaxID=40148 RepID=A0A0E0A932_9ORYZ